VKGPALAQPEPERGVPAVLELLNIHDSQLSALVQVFHVRPDLLDGEELVPTLDLGIHPVTHLVHRERSRGANDPPDAFQLVLMITADVPGPRGQVAEGLLMTAEAESDAFNLPDFFQ